MERVKYIIKYKTGEVIQVTDKRDVAERITNIRTRFERYLLTRKQGCFTFSFSDAEVDLGGDQCDNVFLTVDFRELCSIVEYRIE